jgi:hypothetical protein
MPLPFREQPWVKKWVEPLTLKHGENEYKFNCKPCEMEFGKRCRIKFIDEDEQLDYVKKKR